MERCGDNSYPGLTETGQDVSVCMYVFIYSFQETNIKTKYFEPA